MKWTIIEKKYALRSITNKNLKVPEKPKLKSIGFTYNAHSQFSGFSFIPFPVIFLVKFCHSIFFCEIVTFTSRPL